MTSWSFSNYTLALQCLQKYKYVVVDKLIVEGPESCDLIFGSALHSSLNSLLTGQDGAATFELYWDSYKERDVTYGRFNWEQLRHLGLEFIRKFGKYHAGKYRLEFAEKRLYSEYRGIKLEGTPDYYGYYNDKRSLRDFKTSGRNYEESKRECALQLYLYAYLFLRNHPTAAIDTLGYTVFNKGTGSIQDLTWDFDEGKMYKALDEMVTYAEILYPKDTLVTTFPKNLGACHDYNRKCEFFGKCFPTEVKND